MSSELKVNSIRDTSNNEAITISSGNVSFNNTISAGTLGSSVIHSAGRILQVKQSYKAGETSLSNNAYTNTGLSVNITGSATADSTFLIFATFTIGEVTGTGE